MTRQHRYSIDVIKKVLAREVLKQNSTELLNSLCKDLLGRSAMTADKEFVFPMDDDPVGEILINNMKLLIEDKVVYPVKGE